MPIFRDEKRRQRTKPKRPGANHRVRTFIRAICDKCGKERWITPENIRPIRFTGLCGDCSRRHIFGAAHHNWTGGICLHQHGYIGIRVRPDHPFASMRNARNEIYEHRLRMAEKLGRPLSSYEHVHHINGNRQDNRIENLELVSTQENHLIQALQERIAFLEQHITSCCGHSGTLAP